MSILVIHDGDKVKYIDSGIGLTFGINNVCVVDKLPVPENRPGYSAELKYNETTGLFYDYKKK